MRSLSETMNVSLDGVVQGLGRPDEDTRGGFIHGGWGAWHQDGNDLAIVGSVALVRDLHAAGLINRYTLVIHPVTLGSGSRMFEGPAPLTTSTLTGSVTNSTGVLVAHYDRR